MKEELLTGGCLCRAVAYRSSDAPDTSLICFCLDCQKVSGGGHLPQLRFERESVSFTGSLRTHTVVCDAGFDVEIGFCSICGSTIYKASSRFPDKICLTAGSLDDPSAFRPDARVYESSKQPWDKA